MAADLSVEVFDVLNVIEPGLGVDGEEVLDGVDGDSVEAFDVDVFRLRNVADRSFDGVYLAFAASEDPEDDAEVVAEARPDEVAFSVGSEPVDVPMSSQCWK